MVDIKKRLVGFDSSFLIKVFRGEIDINAFYPINSYDRGVQDTFFDEFYFDWPYRTKLKGFYQNLSLFMQEF